mgnify:CR=1 FL=1
MDVGVSVERDAACHDGKRERGKERAGAGFPNEGGRVRVPCVYININLTKTKKTTQNTKHMTKNTNTKRERDAKTRLRHTTDTTDGTGRHTTRGKFSNF